MANRYAIEAVFKGIDEISAPANRATQSVRNLIRTAKTAAKATASVSNRVMHGTMNAVKYAAMGASLSIPLLLTDVAKTGMQFEQSITNATAKFPGAIKKGTAAYKALEDEARRVGRVTEFTASQSAEALNSMAMAGFSAEGAMKSLNGVVNLATTAEVELSDASEMAADALNMFGFMSDNPDKLARNLQRVNDTMAKVAVTSTNTVGSIYEAMQGGGSLVKATGSDIETFLALTGKISAVAKGSAAGTGIKNIYARLASQTPEVYRLLRNPLINVKTKDEFGNMRDVIDILGDLQDRLKNFGTADQAAIVETIFGKIALPSVLHLLSMTNKELRDYRKEIYAASGASTDMANTMRSTTLGSWKNFLSAIESVKISLFVLQQGPLQKTLDKWAEWLRSHDQEIAKKISVWLDKIIKALPEIWKWLKIIVPLLAGLLALNIVLQAFLGLVQAITFILANPLLIAILALAVFLYMLIFRFKDLQAILQGVPNLFLAIGVALGAILLPISPVIGIILMLIGLAALIVKNWEPIKDFFAQLWDDILFTFKRVDNYLSELPFMKAIAGVLSKVTGPGLWTPSRYNEYSYQHNAGEAQVVTPGERVAKSITENSTTSEIVIRDDTGRATLTNGRPLPFNVHLLPTGGF